METEMPNKRWTNKDGSISERIYDQSKYSKTHYEKNKEKILAKCLCACGNMYSTTNKFNHVQGKQHKMYERHLAKV